MPMGQFIAFYSQMEQVLLLNCTLFCRWVKKYLVNCDVFPFKLDRKF